MTREDMVELFLIHDSAALCDKLIQNIMRIEDLTNKRLNDSIMLPLDRLLRTLRSRQYELVGEIIFEDEAQR